MKKNLFKFILSVLCAVLLLAGCGTSAPASETAPAPTEKVETVVEETPAPAEESTPEESTAGFPLEDGTYSVVFDTDGSMFHVNEVCEGRGELTVENGQAMLHLIMPSKNVLNLYPGTAEEAGKEGSVLLEPVEEKVVYSDGFEDTVYAFNVPVTVLDEEFDLALVGKKGVWYDHKVSISDPIRLPDPMTVELTLEGGTGKASLESPTKVEQTDDGYLVTLSWSSKYYDYMIVDGVTYQPVSTGERSVFEIPVTTLEEPLQVIADTVAMSTPHEIEYTITFLPDTLK